MTPPSTPPREQLDDLPPSCKYVYHVLDREGPLTRQALQEETGLPEGTVTYALDRLKNQGEVMSARDSDDLRRVLYEIPD